MIVTSNLLITVDAHQIGKAEQFPVMTQAGHHLKKSANLFSICQPSLHQGSICMLLPIIFPKQDYLSHVPVIAVQYHQIWIPPMLLLEHLQSLYTQEDSCMPKSTASCEAHSKDLLVCCVRCLLSQ